MPELNVIRSRLPFAKSTAKGPPFSMRGVPAIAANPREGSRLLRFWVKVPNTSSEIGTTLSRARACGRVRADHHGKVLWFIAFIVAVCVIAFALQI